MVLASAPFAGGRPGPLAVGRTGLRGYSSGSGSWMASEPRQPFTGKAEEIKKKETGKRNVVLCEIYRLKDKFTRVCFL